MVPPPRGASEEFLEFLFRQAGVLDDPAHRESIDRIAARNRKDTLTVGQHDVLSLASDAEACFLERAHRPEVVDTGNPRHGLYGNFDLTDHHPRGILDGHVQVLADSVSDVRQGFLLRLALGRATRKAWNPNGESLFGFLKRHAVFQLHLLGQLDLGPPTSGAI